MGVKEEDKLLELKFVRVCENKLDKLKHLNFFIKELKDYSKQLEWELTEELMNMGYSLCKSCKNYSVRKLYCKNKNKPLYAGKDTEVENVWGCSEYKKDNTLFRKRLKKEVRWYLKNG